ncbi:ABC transporter ATP-binding protein [Cumulibacter soli]|uniref:ABC transporter ATP-binding protein n=1 Tax=Cumulibacter soli TaxID=2546344 RepID=UPI001067B029|nr:ABC transporter ATP-binding protein [Cumulibacter soli]
MPIKISEPSVDEQKPVLLDVRDLTVEFATPNGSVTAVRDVSFQMSPGEILGLVGESGSGKSVTGMAMMGLLPESSSRVSGSAVLDGTDLLSAGPKALTTLRGEKIAMIFQDPLTALDPVYTIEQQLIETLKAHRKISKGEARKRAISLLDDVGIPMAASRIKDYPHQLSGGMRQRVMIAISLACNPQLLIADEPTTALDVTIQAQILDLIRDLSTEHQTAVLFISHDLAVISELCSRVMTMYAGEVIEAGEVDPLLEVPLHPYTSGLLASIPRAGGDRGRLHSVPGRVPALDAMPAGCRFGPRCSHVIDQCISAHPGLRQVGSRFVRCARAEELQLSGVVDVAPTSTPIEGRAT